MLTSEDHFQRELAYAGIVGAEDPSEGGAVGGRGWVEEVRVVEDVEKLGVELETEAFGRQVEVLEETGVPVDVAGP